MLISDKHKSLYQEYYLSREFEHTDNRWAATVKKIAERTKSQSVIDYGCGIGATLEKSLPELNIVSYDPGLPEFDKTPHRADMVACMDVLEHVEPETVNAVIDHILSLGEKAIFLVVSCQESESKTLPNGSAWHSFVRPTEWWAERLPQFKKLKPSGNRNEYVGLWEREYGHN